MSITTTRDRENDLTTHVITGYADEKEMHAVLEEDYSSEPTLRVLWDMSQAQVGHVTAEILRNFVKAAAQKGVPGKGGRSAVIAPQDLQFGLARMSEFFTELEEAPFKFSAFRTREEALQWLNAEE
jgi:hypothetical protein